jgi:COX assembly mitochondrial protein 2
LKRKVNFEESNKFKEQLQAYKREIAEKKQGIRTWEQRTRP